MSERFHFSRKAATRGPYAVYKRGKPNAGYYVLRDGLVKAGPFTTVSDALQWCVEDRGK